MPQTPVDIHAAITMPCKFLHVGNKAPQGFDCLSSIITHGWMPLRSVLFQALFQQFKVLSINIQLQPTQQPPGLPFVELAIDMESM